MNIFHYERSKYILVWGIACMVIGALTDATGWLGVWIGVTFYVGVYFIIREKIP